MGERDLTVVYSPLTVPQPGRFCVESLPGGVFLFEALIKVTDQYTAFVEWYWRPNKRVKNNGGVNPHPAISPIGDGAHTFRVEPWNHVGLAKRTGIVLLGVPDELGSVWRRKTK